MFVNTLRRFSFTTGDVCILFTFGFLIRPDSLIENVFFFGKSLTRLHRRNCPGCPRHFHSHSSMFIISIWRALRDEYFVRGIFFYSDIFLSLFSLLGYCFFHRFNFVGGRPVEKCISGTLQFRILKKKSVIFWHGCYGGNSWSRI